jgi:succinate dehydrogenase iron-sulfur subunit
MLNAVFSIHFSIQPSAFSIMRILLKVWRQASATAPGALVDYIAENISPDMSFLEMLDVVNEGLIAERKDPIAFDSDCREGICGTCGFLINGVAHGPDAGTTVCQLHMRRFKDSDRVVLEPWRAKAFPVVKDLVVDRSAFDRIIESGGYVSVSTGGAPDANAIPIAKADADRAMDAAACIGCGACVAACKNASAMLFVAAKISHLSLLPQGKVEKDHRVLSMVEAMDREGFGNCTVMTSCEAVCPKEISLDVISRMNREYLAALLRSRT